jgi:hypothetical protein
MDSKSKCTIEVSNKIDDKPVVSAVYKVIFKDGLYTTLSYDILKKFDLITNIIDDCKSNSIELPNVDINTFMSIIDKSLIISKLNICDIRNNLTDIGYTTYNYLLTDQKVNIVLDSFINNVLELVEVCFEKIKPESFIVDKEYIIYSKELDYYCLYKKYPRLGIVDDEIAIFKIVKYKYSEINYAHTIELYNIYDYLKRTCDNKNQNIDYHNIIYKERTELFKGYFSPLDDNVSIFYIDTNKTSDTYNVHSGTIIIDIIHIL